MKKIIDVNDVSICYKVGDFKQIGLKEYILKKITHKYSEKEFWADRHISFSLYEGDMLGIIGTNGAGKSTLLKVISGVMPPTEGKASVNGKIAALLELTSGFDKELSVKQNTYLRGALLGYTKKFMNEKYDEIISFAELEDFQDRNFGQLSSGMRSRLAFSIACLVDPDVLILDEVLSVGDGYFKEKSSDKMKEILDNGVTGILVSHSLSQIRELCNKVLWLDHGIQVAFGETDEICDAYEDFTSTPASKRKLPENMNEINVISRDFKLYKKMSQDEESNSEYKDVIRGESKVTKEQRWMKIIRNMSEEEKQKVFEKYGL